MIHTIKLKVANQGRIRTVENEITNRNLSPKPKGRGDTLQLQQSYMKEPQV